jgi:hypothetical protein
MTVLLNESVNRKVNRNVSSQSPLIEGITLTEETTVRCFPSQPSRSLTHLVTARDEFVHPGRLHSLTMLRLPREGSTFDVLRWKADANRWVPNPGSVGGSATFATGEFARSVPCAFGHFLGGIFYRF